MRDQLLNDRGITLVVVLMVMAILLSIIGAALLFSGINSKITVNYRIGTKAFYAADTGVNSALNQLTMDTTASTAAFSQDLGGGLKYRSGHRTDSTPQPLHFLGAEPQSGYGLNAGTGYNTSGYSFHKYQMNVTGTYTTSNGTELAGREVEGIARYGPVPE